MCSEPSSVGAKFYADVLWHRPETSKRGYNPAMEHIEVDTGSAADERFNAWCEGRTGFPFIDARYATASRNWMDA